MTDHVFDFGAISPATESLFIRAKLASRLSPFSDSVLAEVRRVLMECNEIAEACVTVNGSRLLAFVSPRDVADEEGFQQALSEWGHFTKITHVRGQKVNSSGDWKYAPLGYVVPTTEKAKKTLAAEDKLGVLFKVPAIIVGLKSLQVVKETIVYIHIVTFDVPKPHLIPAIQLTLFGHVVIVIRSIAPVGRWISKRS